jgi:hypothetical protein
MIQMGAIGGLEMSVRNSQHTLVKPRKSEGLIYTTAEDGNHAANSTKSVTLTGQKTVATVRSNIHQQSRIKMKHILIRVEVAYTIPRDCVLD